MPQGKDKTERAKANARDDRKTDRKLKDAIAPVAKDNKNPAARAGKGPKRDDQDGR